MATIAGAVIAGVVFARDTVKLCFSFATTYKQKRDRLEEKSETLRSQRVDVERRCEAIKRNEIVKHVVDDWLSRAETLLNDHATYKSSAIKCCGCWEAIEQVDNLTSRFDAILSEKSFDAVSETKPEFKEAMAEVKRRAAEKAQTLRSLRADVERRKGLAMDKNEIINELVEDWLSRAETLWNDYDESLDQQRPSDVPATKSGVWLEEIERVEKLISRFDAILAEGSFDAVSETRPEFKKILADKKRRAAEKAETLKARKVDTERRKCVAMEEKEIIKEVVKDWLSRAETLLNDYDESLAPQSDVSRGWFEEIEGVNKLISRFDAVLAEGIFDVVSEPRAPPPPPDVKVKAEAVEWFRMFSSTKAAMDKVMRALRDKEVSVVGVHGMPGVGKTTLVDRAAAQAMHSERLFNRVVSLTVSRSPNLETIQNQAAEHLGLKRLGANLSLEERARLIEDMIVREERVLVVLDDLWEKLDLSRVGVPRVEALEKCKSKIIITTRRADAYTLMGCREKICLDTCSEQESRDFFKGVAGTNFDSREFESVAESVADECKGLPLALYLLAKALGDKPEDEWAHVLRKLRTSQHQNNAVMNELFTAIKVSYDYLGSKEKLCFLVCCLFPEDHNIAREELARYWFGLGLFPEAGTIDQARQRTRDIAKKLEESGLLLAAGGQRVKMHDVIRDVAIQIVSLDRELSKEEKEEGEGRQVFIVQSRNSKAQEWPVRDSYEVYTAISAVSNAIRKLPGSPVCTKLQTLLLQDNKSLCSISDTFFKNMNSLRLLNLSGAQVPSLPPPGESLKMVRVLSLDRCKFTSLPDLGQLKKLAILSLRESVIEELPGGMEHLFDLRILDLTMSSGIRRIPAGVLSGLERLEELYLKGSFAKWHDGTDEKTAGNACFAEIMGLDRLTVLEVDVAGAECLRGVQAGPEAPRWATFDICVCRHDNTRLQFPKRQTDLCTLLLDASLDELPSWFPDAVSKKAERLTYANSKKVDMFGEQQGGRLASLKSLMLDKFTWVTHFIRAASCDAPAVFGGLRELQIHDSSINDICDGEIPQGSLKSLEFLALQFCNEMENSVLPQSLMKRVVSLERLHVSSSKAREVFASYKASSIDSAQQRYLGKLKEMRLVNLYKLDRVWKGPARLADFSGLERVSVIKCEKLRNVFSDISILGSLSRLEDLWIEDCKVMEEVIKVENDIAVTLPSLKTLCLSKLPKLKNLFHSQSIFECPNLEYLHVDKCPLVQAPTSSFHSEKEVRQNDGQHMKTLKKRMTPEYY